MISMSSGKRARLLYVKDIAERLGRTQGQVHWMIQNGQIPTAKIAGRRVMRESDLEDWINSHFDNSEQVSA